MNILAQLMILLSVISNIIMGIKATWCNFILDVVCCIVEESMATRLSQGADGEGCFDANQNHIRKQLPKSLHVAMKAMQLDGQMTTYAVCPKCSFCHKPEASTLSMKATYPRLCCQFNPGRDGLELCGAELLEERHGGLRPIKPFLVASLQDYMARSLSNPDIEKLCDQACDRAMGRRDIPLEDRDMTNVFDGGFLKDFLGPDKKLFIDRGDKMCLAFAMHVDFLNPNGTRKHGNHDSIGLVSMANLNLPEHIRYRPENIFLVGIIPGPREPNVDQISKYLAPIMDVCVDGWERGFHVSKTASEPVRGRHVSLAVILSINDLPAARKVSGNAGHKSPKCTVCKSSAQELDTCYHKWTPRDVAEMRERAFAWRDATTTAQREKIFKESGVRWSEFWRLPYWDPTRMLVVDSMHCLFEGLVHYHCRRVLRITSDDAHVQDKAFQQAFDYDFMQYNADQVPPQLLIEKEHEIKHISAIHRLLTRPYRMEDEDDNTDVDTDKEEDDEDVPDDHKAHNNEYNNQAGEFLTKASLTRALLGKNVPPLKFVCHTLGLSKISIEIEEGVFKESVAWKKSHFTELLVLWVRFNLKYLSG